LPPTLSILIDIRVTSSSAFKITVNPVIYVPRLALRYSADHTGFPRSPPSLNLALLLDQKNHVPKTVGERASPEANGLKLPFKSTSLYLGSSMLHMFSICSCEPAVWRTMCTCRPAPAAWTLEPLVICSGGYWTGGLPIPKFGTHTNHRIMNAAGCHLHREEQVRLINLDT
jgi:hypothetical protein